MQLGDELIRNESIALLELVKNAYDADATEVIVTMNKVDQPKNGTITIQDNGTGMDIETIRNVWMEPGSDSRLLKQGEKRRTEKFHRAFLGEKGIGRFAVHKLGDKIEVTTKKKNKKEVKIIIDWTVFEKVAYLHETPIEVEELQEPQVFTGDKTGTRITVNGLRKEWTRGMVREVVRSWNSLRSPFVTPESFDIKLETDKEKWLEGIMSLEEIREHALYHFQCLIEGNEIKNFEYNFNPFPSLAKIKPRKITENDPSVKKLLKMTDNYDRAIDLSNYGIGPIKFEGYIFDRDPVILALGVHDKKSFKEYLDTNGGIKVYKDGIRVYDYGEPGNDWLNLDIRRVNVPAQRISNNIIIAGVSLDRTKSTELKEKTNREGFIDNESYEKFLSAILYAIHVVETQRVVDKNLLRTYYGPTQKSEPVTSKIQQLKVTVKEKVKEKQIQEEIIDELEKIEKDYQEISERLLRSAGAGLNLGAVVHEVEKIVGEIEKVVGSDTSSRTSILVKHLAELLAGFTTILRKSNIKPYKIKEIIDQSFFASEYRLKAHKITVVKDNQELEKGLEITCAENLILSSILNIIDNSIWWLEYAKIKDKKIFVTCSTNLEGFITIIIADNGPGFALPTEEIVKPWVTGKPTGMGLGLHIVKQVMLSHGGDLIFPEYGDFEIPVEFKDGAIVGLIFRINSKK